MCFLEGGLSNLNTSLLSVAHAVKVDKNGEPGITLFMPEGAVRVRCDRDLWKKFVKLVRYICRGYWEAGG